MVKQLVSKIKIDKIYINSRTGQQFIILPKKKMKEDISGKKIVVSYW